ncbi:hypothetical protein J6590_023723 [Homalodisca vitripennis]|nr:hypothetical protein J6590_023723 [Homalodisca vitripennis]
MTLYFTDASPYSASQPQTTRLSKVNNYDINKIRQRSATRPVNGGTRAGRKSPC